MKGPMPSTAAPAKAPTTKVKLWPVVAGVTLLMIVLAGFDVQREQDATGRHLIALLEWQRDGGVDPIPVMEQLPVWPGMLVGLCVIILASCLAVWVVRKVRTRRSRTERADLGYRTAASGDSVSEVLDQLHDLSPATKAQIAESFARLEAERLK